MLLLRLVYCGLLSVSLFNTVLLCWLGLTVVLNAVRRNWGIWLAAGGLFAGAAVFTSHAAILMEGANLLASRPDDLGQEVNAWWPLGWTAIVFAPFAWYLAILWYAGYWDDPRSTFHRRQRPALALTVLLGAAAGCLVVVSRPLPFSVKLQQLDVSASPALFGLPLLLLIYPVFAVCCTTFSLRALIRPAPELLATAGPARRRARPWLIASSLALLLVSLLVAGGMAWFIVRRDASLLWIVVDRLALDFFLLDLAVSVVIAAAVLMVGQAVVAYEIFTGRSLPAQGLRRQWVNAVKLAAGYGVAVGTTFAVQTSASYVIILATLFVAGAYALFGWRSYQERQRYIAALTSFAASEHVYDAVLSPAEDATTDAATAFATLCREVIGCSRAYLVPSPALTSLVLAPLSYPPGPAPSVSVMELLASCAKSPCALADPERYGGAVWAVSLRGSQGVIGVLLLGEKADGGLYTEEEITVARSSGERLLDTAAGTTLARRLMSLQRQRFIETQVLDQQSRRTLHDEVLPTLHAAMLALSGHCADRPESAEAMAQLADVHRRLSRLLRDMPAGSASLVSRLGLLPALREMVSQEFAADFAAVEWRVEAEAEERTRSMPSPTADVLFYAAKEVVRNAARHARGEDPRRAVHLRFSADWRGGVEIRIADDGVGRAPATASAGGQGLALHSTMLAVIGGSLVVERAGAAGTAVTIFLPEHAGWCPVEPTAPDSQGSEHPGAE